MSSPGPIVRLSRLCCSLAEGDGTVAALLHRRPRLCGAEPVGCRWKGALVRRTGRDRAVGVEARRIGSVIEDFGLDAWFGDDEAGEEGAAVQGFGSGSANQLGVVIVLADVAEH